MSAVAMLIPMRNKKSVVALFGMLALAGCCSEHGTAQCGDLPALDLTGDPAAGASVWEANGCGACHVLSAAGSSGAVGPSLDDTQPSYELVVERVTNGLGAMPAFGESLSPQEIADVAQYVADSTGG